MGDSYGCRVRAGVTAYASGCGVSRCKRGGIGCDACPGMHRVCDKRRQQCSGECQNGRDDTDGKDGSAPPALRNQKPPTRGFPVRSPHRIVAARTNQPVTH